ncbi:MAG: class I SAM-dependent methyltransferase [Nitrospirae bacterium]|nr:class I SAM-dependent methyltransferase [Nitrospirota bacterium]
MSIMQAIVRQKYKEYRSRLLNKYFNKITIKPLMKYREIEIIEDILMNLRPDKCLEWGGGYSTLYFPLFLKNNSKWLSVEHDKDWAQKVRDMNRNPDVEIFNEQPDHMPWTDPNNDGSYDDLKSYIEYPSRFGKFDFILIDGRARKDCLIKALDLVSDRGVVVLHDANRKHYHEPLRLYDYQIMFENYRPKSHGLWIGSKRDIRDVLDVNRHRKLWEVYNNIARRINRIK